MDVLVKGGMKLKVVQQLQSSMRAGRYKLEHGNDYANQPVDSGVTCYLVKQTDGTAKIVTYRQWHQMGRPEYVTTGSYEGCKGHKRRYHL